MSQNFSLPREGIFSVGNLYSSLHLFGNQLKAFGRNKFTQAMYRYKIGCRVCCKKKTVFRRFVQGNKTLLFRGCYCAQKQRKRWSTKPMKTVGQVGLSSLFSCCQFHKYFDSKFTCMTKMLLFVHVQQGIKAPQMQLGQVQMPYFT